MPAFNGEAIFGTAVNMATGDENRESQKNSFFGVNGTESLDGGYRHTITSVKAVHVGEDALTLAGIQDNFRSYKDGLAYVLIDNYGIAWYNVQLENFNPQMPVRKDDFGNYFQEYTATFVHLSR